MSVPDKHLPWRTNRKSLLWLLTAIFLSLGFLYLLYWLIWGRLAIYTDDAYVNGNMVQLMAQIPGTVVSISTDDTLYVQQGQTLIQLDPADMKIAFDRAQATLAQTIRQVRQYFENANQAAATLTLRKADLVQAQADLMRRKGLLTIRAISREELQHYQTAGSTQEAAYRTALYQFRSAIALVENSNLYDHPLIKRAEANLQDAYLNLQRTTIVAPVSGYVAKRNVQVGQQVSVMTPMLAVIPLNNVWVDANYKESQLGRIRIGQPVTLYADAYSGVTYHGKVLGLNPGTGSAFALLPPQNATGNWIKIVQRLPVRIELDKNELRHNPLALGLSMRVTVDTGNLEGKRLSTLVNQKPIYTTDVYADQLAHVNVLIDKILHDNAPYNISMPQLSTG